MLKSGDLEKELRDWRANRAKKNQSSPGPVARRTIRVNGRDVLVLKKPKRSLA